MSADSSVSPPAGFDFTLHMRRVCEDMASRLPELGHIDMSRVALSFSQTRRPDKYGMHASLTPMRFAGGAMQAMRRGRLWTIQSLRGPDGREMLYILNFYLPRDLDLQFREKLTTLAHELWHIGPRFDGDLRRYRGRFYAHGRSHERYDAHAARLAEAWLAAGPPESLYAFLHSSFRDLVGLYGRVFGRKIPAPRLLPLPWTNPRP